MVKQNAFLTCSWRFLRLDKLEQLKSKLEKIVGIEKHAGKVRKISFLARGSRFSLKKKKTTKFIENRQKFEFLVKKRNLKMLRHETT